MPIGKSLNSGGKMCHAYHREMKFESCVVFFCKKTPQEFEGTFGCGYVHHLAPFVYQLSVLLRVMVHVWGVFY